MSCSQNANAVGNAQCTYRSLGHQPHLLRIFRSRICLACTGFSFCSATFAVVWRAQASLILIICLQSATQGRRTISTQSVSELGCVLQQAKGWQQYRCSSLRQSYGNKEVEQSNSTSVFPSQPLSHKLPQYPTFDRVDRSSARSNPCCCVSFQ